MHQIARVTRALISDDDGATMVEYGIMVALIAAVCIVIIATLGGQVQTAFNDASAGI